ncbi:MAG: biotin/lipoyl-containing protein [Chloroflexota bacterium]
MTETLHLTVEGKTFVVEVDDLSASPLTVRVNGRPFTVELAGKATQVSNPPAAEYGDGPSSPAMGSGDVDVREMRAPMPGNILDLAVGPGDRVVYRQVLCNLEAMKMKNALRSPRQGAIAAVHVREGQTVAYGDLLFTFE